MDVQLHQESVERLLPWLHDSALVQKIYFPREAPIVGAVLAASVEFWVGIALVLVVGPFLGARLGWPVVLVPVLFVVLALLAVGVSLAFGALNIYYRDVRYILPFGIQLWMFASPVIYPVSTVPARWRGLYAALNPAVGLVDTFRRVLASGVPPDPFLLGVSTAGAGVLAWAGYRLFKRLEPAFADVL